MKAALSDEEFKEACSKIKDVLVATFGEAPQVRDVMEVLNTVIISVAFTVFTAKGINDVDVLDKNRDELLRILKFMWDQYQEIFLKNFDEFQKLVVQEREGIKKLEEEFPEATSNAATKEALELLTRMGVDTSKLKH